MSDEKTPLLSDSSQPAYLSDTKPHASWIQWTTGAITGTFRMIISAVFAPGRWLIACFYDDAGNFSLAMPIHRIGRKLSRRERKKAAKAMQSLRDDEKEPTRHTSRRLSRTADVSVSGSSSADDIGPLDDEPSDTPSRNTRSRSLGGTTAEDSDASTSPKRSIRIREAGADTLKQRKQRPSPLSGTTQPALTVDNLKSPRSPTSSLSLTKYPRAPAPPRPLIPRRQPSYTFSQPNFSAPPQKTLVLDLDETLIHSQARGGRMSTGHMVEVKINSPVGAGGQVLAPQVPILYHVHKRPYCDEFLRKVSKWYNLVAFTASVQEYADPVIDWLELERKYFSARYYRQHCTYKNGAYIKDLGQVEPDLSKVIILDNSAFSFLFHEG